MSENLSIAEGQILTGPIFSEPMRVETVRTGGDGIWTIGLVGIKSERFRKVSLTAKDLEKITILDTRFTYDGNSRLLRVGLQAYALGIAYEFDPYFGISISRVDPLPHQLEAIYDYLLKVARVRFLLADDAGAGKTIMASLLIRELQLRGLVERILIVCPANLSFQWQRELKEKFDEKFVVLKGGDIRDQFGVNQWLEHKKIITSLDLAKRDEILAGLRQVQWDLVIVDEAHRMSWTPPARKTARYALGELLRDASDHILLLTATPHKGDPENFSLFLQLLDADAYADVQSISQAMERRRAPFYLRRTKEAMVYFNVLFNYDIPWNPNRLEQRMGRIHRYGQHKDCLIFNFVATNTIEGRVLQRLVEKLQEIRDALDDDAVFNVVGEILPAAHVERILRDYYAGKLGDADLEERILENVDERRFRAICQNALDGLGHVIHERLFAVEMTENEGTFLREPGMLGNFAPAYPPETLPPVVFAQEPLSWLHENAFLPFLEEVRNERVVEVDRIAEHVELSLTELVQRADDEIGRASEEIQKGIAGAEGRLAQAENRHADLMARRERRRKELERQRSLTLQTIERIASVLVLPHPEREAPEIRRLQPNLETEIAAATGTILLTPNERRVAEDRRDCYWLYVVTDCNTTPTLREPIRDPAKFEWHEVKKISHYYLSVDSIAQPMNVREDYPPYSKRDQ